MLPAMSGSLTRLAGDGLGDRLGVLLHELLDETDTAASK